MSFNILIVDDSTTLLSVYKKLLQKSDVKVDTADTIGQAVEYLVHNVYDVAIVDLHLTPLMGEEGLVILRYIKELYPITNVILVTASGSPRAMKEAREYGASFYFEKPFRSVQLKNALLSMGMTDA
jgi:DNA-binding response OmpR family regulator